MTDEDNPFGEDFGSFDDFLAGIKPGEHRPLSGILRYRQGADPLDWSEMGAQKYIPGGWQMLAGAIKWTGAAATFGALEFDFATQFGNNPLFIISPVFTWPLLQDIRVVGTIQNRYTVQVAWWSAVNLTQAGFNWIALGPVGP